MSLNLLQLKDLVVKPVLKDLGMYSIAAEQLVLGTICQESGGIHLKQLGGGPALGICQMEPNTHKDIWINYLKYQRDIVKDLAGYISAAAEDVYAVADYPDHDELISNLKYSVAMCRVHFWRKPNALPKANDINGLASYWKQFYNTVKGAGKVEEFINNFPFELYGLKKQENVK
ncbi:hypothetical protein [Marinomonas sp. PE14-40]|uniref:hypothetical protein n=1 Tax=Marinomonas sp. PE14-40 TaxID=3060621 RepID=UPI003F668C2F